MLPSFPCQLLICSASIPSISADGLCALPCINYQACASLQGVWQAVRIACVESIKKSLSRNLSGLYISLAWN
jgi:hypothetical protein